MSPKFMKLFAKEMKCPKCQSPKLFGRSLCALHLDQAKEKWRVWSIERRKIGKCCYCDCKSFNGWLRCRKHTKINRKKCREWMKIHGHRRWEERKAETLRTGLCVYCSAKKPVILGTLRCIDCKNKLKESRRK